jgi:hypothetical protein
MPLDGLGRTIPLDELAGLDGHTLRICLPLTPTQNEHQRWKVTKYVKGKPLHFSKGKNFRAACLTVATHQVRAVLGRFEPPWAQLVEMNAIRCGPRACDPSNVTAGLKEAIDVLLVSRPDRPGVGLVPDDSSKCVRWKGAEAQGPKDWGAGMGPGTWFFITKLR